MARVNFRLKNRWNKKLSFRWNKTWVKSIKVFVGISISFEHSQLLRVFSSFHFSCYWMPFRFFFCFISQYFCRYCEFCNKMKMRAITAGIKKYKSIIKKKKKKHDKIVLLRKTKLNTIEVVINKALIDFYINHNEFVSVNNVLKEYN